MLFGDFGVFEDAGFATEMTSPFADGVFGFLFYPGIDFFVAREFGGQHEIEAVHERVVDGTLEAGGLANFLGIVVFGIADDPLPIAFAERSAPGAVGGNAFTGEGLAVDGDFGSGSEWSKAGAGFKREMSDVGGGGADAFGGNFGVDAGLLPMFLEAFEGDPVGFVVTEGVGGELHVAGQGIASAGGDGVDALVDLDF